MDIRGADITVNADRQARAAQSQAQAAQAQVAQGRVAARAQPAPAAAQAPTADEAATTARASARLADQTLSISETARAVAARLALTPPRLEGEEGARRIRSAAEQALRNDPRFIMLVRMIENYTGASVQAVDVEAALGADEPLEAPPPAVPPSPARGAEAYASTPAEAPPPPRIDVSA